MGGWEALPFFKPRYSIYFKVNISLFERSNVQAQHAEWDFNKIEKLSM